MKRVKSEHRDNFFIAIGFAAILVWSYWPTLRGLVHSWSNDPENAHGPLVLAFCGYLIYRNREKLRTLELRQSIWGFLLLLAAIAMRMFGSAIYSTPLDQLSLIPTLAGIVWTAFGWPACKALLPALGYALFAIPLHGRIGFLFTNELQSLASVASTYILQTFGIPAQREGNIIILSEVDLGIVEACSGLRMMMSFLAIAVAVAMLIERPLWQRLFIVATALPIGVLCNIIRITTTGILHETAGKDWADFFFHDFAGWLMMPMALVMIWLEVILLDRVMVPVKESTNVPGWGQSGSTHRPS